MLERKLRQDLSLLILDIENNINKSHHQLLITPQHIKNGLARNVEVNQQDPSRQPSLPLLPPPSHVAVCVVAAAATVLSTATFLTTLLKRHPKHCCTEI